MSLCVRCKKREGTTARPEGGPIGEVCGPCRGWLYADWEHELSQRWIRDMRSRNARWMPPLGGDGP
jgi:hypothetical protein